MTRARSRSRLSPHCSLPSRQAPRNRPVKGSVHLRPQPGPRPLSTSGRCLATPTTRARNQGKNTMSPMPHSLGGALILVSHNPDMREDTMKTPHTPGAILATAAWPLTACAGSFAPAADRIPPRTHRRRASPTTRATGRPCPPRSPASPSTRSRSNHLPGCWQPGPGGHERRARVSHERNDRRQMAPT